MNQLCLSLGRVARSGEKEPQELGRDQREFISIYKNTCQGLWAPATDNLGLFSFKELGDSTWLVANMGLPAPFPLFLKHSILVFDLCIAK